MAELEAQIQSAGPAKDTVAKVAEEFRTFRELVFAMLGMIRKQINECSHMIDVIETRHRQKALIFLGAPEAEKENCKTTVLDIMHKMGLTEITESCIAVSHRLGVASKNHRPILVRFVRVETRSLVWRAKAKLKGSSVSIKEFLTKSRQAVFGKAQLHFGMRACWTQDGVIVVKAADGSRHKIVTMDELSPLMAKFPNKTVKNSAENMSPSGDAGSSSSSTKTRK
ncbi:unnamed protein product, partial [Iphiclides podalirius]